jgi:NAD(P)-dependent dehydrogenase (short-subunit alcohol dehydrogenase family)
MGVYLITGGANGIGANIAARLRGNGHSIMFADIARVDLPGVRSVICDLTDEGQIASLLFGVEALEGKLDGLVCHAAANGADDDFAGTGLLINAAARLLREGRGAAMAIDSGKTTGLSALARTLSRNLGPEIRVGCIAPFYPEQHFESLAAYLAS